MQLTESQLDIAARKLCELWGLDGDVNVAVLDGAKRKVESVFRVNNNTIAAILHAVTTTQQKDEPPECSKCGDSGWLWWQECDDFRKTR